MLESFFIYGSVAANVEKGDYNLSLIVLSYVVACFSCYTALTLAQLMADDRYTAWKRLIHWGGAFALGGGIWSMHFIGMLAYKMRMTVNYDLLLTLVSLLVATAVAYGVLAIIDRTRLSVLQILAGAFLLGFGICAMHYTGMAAMQMDADLRYIPSIFFLSVLIAIVASAAALWMAFTFVRHTGAYRNFIKVGAALIMGAAICGMHYTGMAASVFMPFADCRYDPEQSFNALALVIAVISSMILQLALIL
jgi:NO-binding membrane sensor protein with MHYT domain